MTPLLRRAAGLTTALRNRLDTTPFHPGLRLASVFLPSAFVTPTLLPLIRKAMSVTGRGTTEVALTAGGVSMRVHRPSVAQSRTAGILWIHGGGYVLGTPGQNDGLCRHFAAELGAVVAAVAYRLAPEHPYPAALDDCYDALQWLGAQPDVDAERIVIGGDSAGGGLAAALAFAARDRGGVQPVFQLLSYPMLDDRSVRPDLETGRFRLWNTRANRFGWESYLGTADPAEAVPARRTDLAGLAPAWIGIGTLDLFHSENLAYAERLRAAGVPCDIYEVDGAFHAFDGVCARAGISRTYRAAQVAALRSALSA